MSFLDFIQNATSSSSYDMAIDLGTANTLVAITGQGIVINEPSVVAIERSTHRVLAVGHEAKNMINHTPDTFSAEHPLHDGVIADYDVTEAMISAFINKAAPRRYPWQPKPRIVVCIPCGATSVEKRAVFEATIQAGARQAYLIEEPMAAAMGADLPVTEPTGSMVVDIGGGTTEVAVISLGGIVTSSSLRLAGNRLDEAIAVHLRDLLGIKIGERTAEVIKIKIGSILPFEDGRERDMIISGQDVLTEQPKEVTIQSEDVRDVCRLLSTKWLCISRKRSRRPTPTWPPTSFPTAFCSRAAAVCSLAWIAIFRSSLRFRFGPVKRRSPMFFRVA